MRENRFNGKSEVVTKSSFYVCLETLSISYHVAFVAGHMLKLARQQGGWKNLFLVRCDQEASKGNHSQQIRNSRVCGGEKIKLHKIRHLLRQK